MPGNEYQMAGGPSIQEHVEGLLAWWALAGVDSAITETPVNWLKPQPVASRPNPHMPAPSVQAGFPDTLEAFHIWLQSATDLPEGSWPGPRIIPKGPASPPMMILVHAPDSGASGAGAPLAPDSMRLMERIIQAIGLQLSECYIASLSIVAPAGGILEVASLEALTARMRHHIGLVAPKSLLLLGDQVNRALNPTGGLDPKQNLPFVNHSGGIVPAVAIAHPRLMLGQPLAKADAWRILQELVKGWGQ